MKEQVLSEQKIKKRVASGLLYFGGRQILTQTIVTSTNIILARIFAPKIFGAFAIISFFVLIVGILTTLGLGPAIVQKKGKLAKRQLRAIFTTQVSAAIIFVGLIYLLAPLIDVFYGGELGSEGVFWLRLFSFTLIFTNAAAVSTFLLQRNLEYKKLTIGAVLALFITQSTVVILALRGMGVGSFVLGNLVGSLASLFIFFYLSPWSVGVNFRLRVLKPILPFGLNYQLTSLIGIINGAVIPVYVGGVSGSRAVGLVNWAGGVRSAGLAPLEIVKSLIFPAASRAQDNKKLLKVLVEKILKLSSMLSFPLLALIFVLAEPLTYIIYTSKWLAGLTALYLSLIQGVFILIGVIMIDVLLALGRAKTVRNITLFWAILQWTLTIPLVLLWNFNGVVLAGLIVSSTFFIPLRAVKKKIDVKVKKHTLPYLLYSLTMGTFVFLLSKLVIIESLIDLIVVGLVGLGFYLSLLMIFERKSLFGDIKVFRELLKN